LGNGELSGGLGALISKRVAEKAEFHMNVMFELVNNPEVYGTRIANLQNAFLYRAGVGFPVDRPYQIIAEVDGKAYFGSRTPGLNSADPIDFLFGLRAYPKEWMTLGFGYRASVNHVLELPTEDIYSAGTNGFVAQLTLGTRRNDPPTVSCAVSPTSIKQDETAAVRVSALDPDGDDLIYTWTSSGGRLTGSGDTVTFDATGIAPGEYTITATVSDGKHDVPCTASITVIKKNEAPTVTCQPTSTSIIVGEDATVRASASDPNNDSLTYSWTVNGERLAATGPSVTFGSAGRQPGSYTITATVSDGELTATCSCAVTVREKPNRPPTIECLTSEVDVAADETVQLRVRASDPDGDSTTISYSTTGGRISGSGETATFNAAGLRAGSYTVTATVNDGRGGRASCTMTVYVSQKITLGGFRTGRPRLDNVAKAALDDLAVQMQSDPRLRANIIGYTDNSRTETRATQLGARRAQAAADYLQEKGIDASRLTVTDGGTNNPIGDNSTAEGRELNRRVEIILSVR
jgi:outer membrane protein OmpA-like peptidoglycan-associated protein